MMTVLLLAAVLANTPRAVAPALDLKAEAAVNAYLTQLVEEFENRKVGNDLDVDLYPGAQACKVAADAKTAACEVTYLQDRYNGTMLAEFALNAQGTAVALTKATFDGFY